MRGCVGAAAGVRRWEEGKANRRGWKGKGEEQGKEGRPEEEGKGERGERETGRRSSEGLELRW